TGCEENIFPHSRALFEPADLEEERRLMYVGMTRAKERLYLLFARHRLLYGGFSENLPSRFLREIPRAALALENLPQFLGGGKEEDDGELHYTPDEEWMPQYAIGEMVEHPSFGTGKITAIAGDILTIDFGNGNIKRFAASIAPLKKIEDL